ncbi:MAG: hypothetical protein COV69_02405 [Parcubacteria group bacterium CG11_big_fil_rev_8_21_14_0_20_39_14]|nr:MAG: hypothetical protein COV69_02405 [Parcubacteria group bacterium CG11_big_fil_rev_8_21_14_0_20_39_14]PIS35657.1 MAG: hypothetical protein COT36_01260 [Parcubacteria group bacterium CG08_land_8_20_14_0_20_38_56]
MGYTKTNPLSVALYFLRVADKEKKPITNLKLQKLVYYAQVWHIVFHNRKLFYEPIEAWMHGPAIPTLYRRFKAFESNPIQLTGLEDIKLPFNEKEEKFLKNVWNVYGKYDAGYLEALTHSELPWQEARQGLSLGEHSSNKINLAIAKHYYARRLTASKRKNS